MSYTLGIFCSFIVQIFQKNSQNIILLNDFYVWAQKSDLTSKYQ